MYSFILSIVLIICKIDAFQDFFIEKNEIVFRKTNSSINIRGISWFGFETDLRVVEGLHKHTMDYYLKFLNTYDFNVLRIPFSSQLLLYEPTAIPDQKNIKADSSLRNLKCIDILHTLIKKCHSYGIAVILDFHVLRIRHSHPLWYLPYDDKYSPDHFWKTWEFVIETFQNYSNILGIELINEPHGNATIGDGNRFTDIEILIKEFLDKFPNSPLLFVNGVSWGKDYQGFQNTNLFINGTSSKIVISPHLYGPTLGNLSSYSIDYLNFYYEKLFAFLVPYYPVVITEWGFNPNTDMIWVDSFIQSMKWYGISNACFWMLNPYGKDIHGLLQPDWETVDMIRIKKIKELSPSPTNFTFT